MLRDMLREPTGIILKLRKFAKRLGGEELLKAIARLPTAGVRARAAVSCYVDS